MKSTKWTLLALLALYIASYGAFRVAHTEIRGGDGVEYVAFPANSFFLYYAYRPLSYLDNAVTGIDFHIGLQADA